MRLETRPTEPTPEAENREKEDEEEEEEAVDAVLLQVQGCVCAQSGHREARRSLRQTGQIPLQCRFDGCFGHFQTSSSLR
ncbi:hypothetical protein SLE2022_277970 [Rubroshorea leprosula]